MYIVSIMRISSSFYSHYRPFIGISLVVLFVLTSGLTSTPGSVECLASCHEDLNDFAHVTNDAHSAGIATVFRLRLEDFQNTKPLIENAVEFLVKDHL